MQIGKGRFNMKYKSIDTYPNIILHDCYATAITVIDENLNLEFADGFWIVGNSKYNSHEETLRTDLSHLQFTNCDFEDINISLFKDYRLFRNSLFTIKKNLSLEELYTKVNSGQWNLEFIEEYYAYSSALFQCAIHTEYKPYYYDCQIEIGRYDEMVYYWDNLRSDMTF